MKKPKPELPAAKAELLDLGSVMGHHLALGLVAGRCSAAQAAGLRRLREAKLYKCVSPHWQDFCVQFLKTSRAQADHLIQLLDEFGPRYFELSQLTRISPQTYRAIAPAFKDGALEFHGQTIELIPENSRQVAAAVAELRRSLPRKKPSAPETHIRLAALNKQCIAIFDEFAEIARRERYSENWIAFTSILTRIADRARRLERECGLS